MPALFFLLLVFGGYALFFLNKEGAYEIYKGILLALSYVSNWVFALNPKSEVGTLGITWSLAVEEQFYLVWPITMVLFLKSRLQRRWMIYGLILTILVIALHRKLLWENGAFVRRLYYASDTRADALLIGCLVGLVVSWNLIPQGAKMKFYMRCLAVASLLFVGYLSVTASYGDKLLYAQGGYTFVALAIALPLCVLLVWPPKFALAALRLRPLVWFGRVSYGLYLWHWPLRVLIFPAGRVPTYGQVALTLVLSLALTALSFYCIEKPFLRLKHRFSNA
jgi:peptidoglycan/LPS O-acetylase OafA/YrhL